MEPARMLAERVKDLLHTNQLVVTIGARGTGKSHCVEQLCRTWRDLGVQVLRLDAATAKKPQDLDLPLTAALGCSDTELTARFMPEDRVLRVIVDRAEYLYDRSWLGDLQEHWRALLSDGASRGRLAIVFFGRPIFRQIAGGDSSPLLNAGPVITPCPLTVGEIEQAFGADESCAAAVRRKTGGHPQLTATLLDAIDNDVGGMGGAIDGFVADNHRYVMKLIQDHPLAGRAVLAELLEARSAMHHAALVRRHFGSAHADGMDAIDDLEASGLLARGKGGDCAVGAELLRSIDGLRGLLGSPTVVVADYDREVMGKAARLVFVAENRLRKLVAESLTNADPAWWVSRVCPELRGDAEGRREGEGEVLSLEDMHLHPIMYLNLGEVFDLIYEKENWNRIFRAIFPAKKTRVEDSARRFSALRNRVAHSRPLSPQALEDLEAAIRQLGLADDK